MNKEDFGKILKILGKRLHDLRIEQNISLDILAKKSGIRKEYLKKIEEGNSFGIGILQIFSLCMALKVYPSDLLKDI